MSGLDERSDEELLQATGGEPTAFGVFYRRHARLVLACAVRRLGDAELAADVTSEVFAAALASSDRFDPARGSARSWLFGILANQVGSALRSRMADSRARRRLGMEPIPLADDQRAWIEADGRLGDLRDVASGGLAVASAGLVVIVLAFMMAPRAHRAVTQQGAAQHGVALAGGVQAGGAQTGGAGSAGTAPGASDAPLCARVDARRGGTWTAAGSAPDEGLRSLLDAAAPVTGLARTVC